MSGRVRSLARLSPKSTAVFVCDIQERFRSLIYNMDSVMFIGHKMLQVSRVLEMPAFVTEQYPKALGRTVAELKMTDFPSAMLVEKVRFSMLVPDVEEKLRSWTNLQSVILCGLEAHVCIQQTALDLLDRGYEVHLLLDGTSSQRLSDRSAAFRRLENAGVVMTSFESAAMELLKSADHPRFRDISALLKEPRPEVKPYA